MLVSIIITTKNEEKNIARCLESIAGQDDFQDETEVILVDNRSADGTIREVEKFSERLNLKIFSGGPERSAQRNRGVREAAGKYILYLDADMRLSPGLVGEAVQRLEADPQLAGLHVPEIVEGSGFWIKIRRFERSFYDGTVIDAVRFVRRDVFQKIGGFDESLTGPEDWDFDRRVREEGDVALIQSPLFHNEDNFDLKHYLRKKAYYQKDMAKYVSKWGPSDPIIRKQLGFGYRFGGVFLEKGRWKKLVRHPLLAVGMFCLRLLVGISYIFKKSVI